LLCVSSQNKYFNCLFLRADSAFIEQIERGANRHRGFSTAACHPSSSLSHLLGRRKALLALMSRRFAMGAHSYSADRLRPKICSPQSTLRASFASSSRSTLSRAITRCSRLMHLRNLVGLPLFSLLLQALVTLGLRSVVNLIWPGWSHCWSSRTRTGVGGCPGSILNCPDTVSGDGTIRNLSDLYPIPPSKVTATCGCCIRVTNR
jgi:hypothetical protein